MPCIFCEIANGKIPCAKIWEDSKHLAFLDINPNTKGQAIVITKQHYSSYAFDMPEQAYEELMLAAKKVAKVLERGLNVQRVAMVMEGTGVDHVHIKLYPLHGVEKHASGIEAKERIYFEKYEGYITTKLGPQADFAELQKLAEEIRNKAKV